MTPQATTLPPAPSLADGRPLLTPQQVSVRLAVPVRTLRQWRHLGIGPRYLKLGDTPQAAVRYEPGALDDYIAAQRGEAGGAS